MIVYDGDVRNVKNYLAVIVISVEIAEQGWLSHRKVRKYERNDIQTQKGDRSIR